MMSLTQVTTLSKNNLSDSNVPLNLDTGKVKVKEGLGIIPIQLFLSREKSLSLSPAPSLSPPL